MAIVGRLLREKMRPARVVGPQEQAEHDARVRVANAESARQVATAVYRFHTGEGEPRSVIFNSIVEATIPLVGKLAAMALADAVIAVGSK